MSWTNNQCCEYDPVSTAERSPEIPLDRERAENGDAHTLTVDPTHAAVNGCDTAVIPAPTPAIPR